MYYIYNYLINFVYVDNYLLFYAFNTTGLMQILKLVSIHDFIQGGSSRPLLITAVNHEGIIKQYVMKLYKTDWVEQNYTVAKEVFISELAKEFNLSTPNYGLIKVDDEMLLDFFIQEEIDAFDKGYKFCSEFMGQYTPVEKNLISLPFIKQYDIENLFCFDNLIFNVDRGGYRNKPNLLINDEEFLLIDHEQTLPFINNSEKEVNYYLYIKHYQHQLHITSNFFKSLRKKDNLFDEFFESLRLINVNKYHQLFDDMDEVNIQYGNREKIFSYLNWAKTNIGFIHNHLSVIIR